MIQETERCTDENETNNLKIETKNSLETHGMTMRSTSNVEEMKSKFEFGHKKNTQEAARARNRSDKNRWGEKCEFGAKQNGPRHHQDAARERELI